MQPSARCTVSSVHLTSPIAASKLLAAPQPSTAEHPPRSARGLGLTVDLLPIALSASAGQLAASGQVWAGLGHARLRLVAERIAFLNWLAGSHGFEQQRTSVGAVPFDHVLGGHFHQWWVGSGFEYRHRAVGYRRDAGARASWNTPVWTLGGGYIAPLAGSFNAEPWLAGHLALTQASPSIGGQLFRPPRANGEVSLKLGFLFDL